MRCYIDPDKISAAQPDEDEDVEQFESDARNDEQVPAGDLRRVVANESEPCPRGRCCADSVEGDRRFRVFSLIRCEFCQSE
jgi:hypothetical protein